MENSTGAGSFAYLGAGLPQMTHQMTDSRVAHSGYLSQKPGQIIEEPYYHLQSILVYS